MKKEKATLQIIEQMQRLKSKWENSDIDRRQLSNIINFLKTHYSDKESFERHTEKTVHLLELKELDQNGTREWLNYAENIMASYIAITLYEDKTFIETKEIPEMIEFFRNAHCSREIKAFGIYACAYTMNESNPMVCYELTKEAFEIYQELGTIMNIQYIYRPDELNTAITEKCPICGGIHVMPYYCSPQILKLNNRKAFPPAKLWMKCEECNNFYTYDFPLFKVDKINGHYTTPAKGQVMKNRFPLDVYDPIFKKLRKYTSGKEYLEVGIGNGEMLAVAMEYGFHVKAVEICKEDCERVSAGLNIDIAWSDILNYETDENFDVVIMGDVLEHVTDPVAVLAKQRNY